MHARQFTLPQTESGRCRHFCEGRRSWRCFSSGKKGFGKPTPPQTKKPKKAKPSGLEQYHQMTKANQSPDLQLKQPDLDSTEPAPVLEPNQLLELFMGAQPENRPAIATRFKTSLSSNFFVTADFLLKQAEIQDHDMVIFTLKDIIRVAMAEKSSQLRPELQLLNRLLVHETVGSRIPVLQDESTLEIARMNDGFIFTCIDHMIKDSEAGMKNDDSGSRRDVRQALGEGRQDVHQQLLDIRKELRTLLETSLPG